MIKVEESERLPPGLASPYARLLAKEKGIELEELQKAGVLLSPTHGRDIQNLIKDEVLYAKGLRAFEGV